MKSKRACRLALAGGAIFVALSAHPADQSVSNAPTDKVLMLDNLGEVVEAKTNEIPRSLVPPPDVGTERQTPEPAQGASQPAAVQQRHREAAVGFRFLPSVPPPLAPYLASQNQFGNLAAHPGAVFPVYPLEPLIQGPKYWLSQYGLNYSLQQTYTAVSMSDVMAGENNLGYYTARLKAAWSLYDSSATGTAGWIKTQLDAKTGFGSAGQNQSARSNLGTITQPTSVWSGVNGLRVPELAWGQSLCDGKLVALGGVVRQGNYIDQNVYAQSGRGQFINSALTQSGVMPLPQYSFGANLQWQPLDEWYAMVGSSVGANKAGYAPWTDLNLNTWTVLGELGYAPKDVLGLGPGIYRVEPFLAEVDDSHGAGLCFNLQQKLGPHSRFGWFGRFGFGGKHVSSHAAAQIGTGFVLKGPFGQWPVKRISNDLLGVGFVWSQPSASDETVYHRNEYVLETFYTMQLSPTLRLQPDVQYVIDPAFNNKHDRALVFQLQLVLSW